MINFDYVTKENIKEHNPNCPKIPDNLSVQNINNGKLWIWNNLC